MENIIASMPLIAQEPDGTNYIIDISIDKPYPYSQDEWVCPIAIVPWKMPLRETRGINSFQALSLAVSSIIHTLQQFKHEGGSLMMDAEHEFPLEALSVTLVLHSNGDGINQYPEKN